MKRIIIDQTKYDGLKTDLDPDPNVTHYDYRVNVTRISNNASESGSDGEIILNTASKKVVKYTGNGTNISADEYPIEQNVVYLVPVQIGNETIYKLYVWNGVALEEIGTSTLDADTWNSGTYIIATDIYRNVIMGGPSTLIFEGGVFWIGLQGNQTVIQAPPVRIFGNFDIDSNESPIPTGSFVNKSAYPEWWGAVPSPINIHSSSHDTSDNSDYIQRAFDSCFGEIEFCCGNYYVGSTLILTKMKTIKMQGLGLRKNKTQNNDFTTVIWTNQNIDVLKIDIPQEQTSNGRLLIEGGEINVSECKGDATLHDNVWINEIDSPSCYTSNAILFNPTGEWGGKISVSIIGPILYAGRTNGQIDWEHITAIALRMKICATITRALV